MIQRNGKIAHALGLGELILLKWPYYWAISRVNAIPIKIPRTFFRTRADKIYMEPQVTPNYQSNSEKKRMKVGGHTLT